METYTYHLHIDVSAYNKKQIKTIIFKSHTIIKAFNSKIIETRKLSELVDDNIIYVIDITAKYSDVIELEQIIKNVVKSMLELCNFDSQLYLEPIKIKK